MLEVGRKVRYFVSTVEPVFYFEVNNFQMSLLKVFWLEQMGKLAAID